MDIDRNLKQSSHLDDFFKAFKVRRHRFETENGVCLFVGSQGSGKTTSLCEALNRFHDTYGDMLRIYSNMELHNYNDGSPIIYTKIKAEEFYAVDCEAGFQNVFVIDEISSIFTALTGQTLDGQVLVAWNQIRKRNACVLATAQRYGRLKTALLEQVQLIVQCRRLSILPIQLNTMHYLDDATNLEELPPSCGFYFFVPHKAYQAFDSFELITRKEIKKCKK